MYEPQSERHDRSSRGWGTTPFFYRSPTHDEAIARLHFLIERRRQLALLLGPAGSGKTLVLDVLGRELRATGSRVVYGNLLGWDGDQFLWELARQLHSRPSPQGTRLALWRSLEDRLTENRYQQVATVLLLDDADSAARDVLSQVVQLLHRGSLPDARLTIVLAANRDQARNLGRRILDRSELRIELDPWDPDEIVHYLQSLLARAGADDQVFDPAGAARLYELSGGIPRQVSHLAELALAAVAGADASRIDAGTIDAVFQELSILG